MQQQRTKWDTALWVQRFRYELAKRVAKRRRERRQNIRRFVVEGGCVVLVPLPPTPVENTPAAEDVRQ
jgi:hypothetical protein